MLTRFPGTGTDLVEPTTFGSTGLRPALAVITSTPADVVAHAGGWLCDSVLLGWSVIAFAVEPRDELAMRILGVPVAPLSAFLHEPDSFSRVAAIAVTSALLEDDDSLRDDLSHELTRTQVTVVGGNRPTVWDGFEQSSYTPSTAARAFKRHALAALGHDGPVEPTETLSRPSGSTLRDRANSVARPVK